MNRVMLIIAGVMLMASGAITTAIGVIQSNKEDSRDEQAAQLCESDETLIRSDVTVEGGGMTTVYNCRNNDGIDRVVTPTGEAKGFLAAYGVAMVGISMAMVGFVILIVGLTRRPPEEGTPVGYQFTPAPMTVTTLPGGGSVMTSNMVSLNGQPLDLNAGMGHLIQQTFGMMNMMFDHNQHAGLDINGILQMALQQLDAAHAAGTIDEAAYQTAREKIMRNMQQ